MSKCRYNVKFVANLTSRVQILSNKIYSGIQYKVCQVVQFLTCVSHTAHVIAIGCPSVRPSIYNVLYCVETAKPIVKLSSLHGSPMILVL